MNERISDKHIRESKIQRLKAKILKEIEEYSAKTKAEIKISLEDDNEFEDWDWLISREFVLTRLKHYIKTDFAFQHFELRDESNDLVNYCVSDDELNIWLQEDYCFVSSFLNNVDDDNAGTVDTILNDRFFGYEFTSIFERIIYQKRIEDCEK